MKIIYKRIAIFLGVLNSFTAIIGQTLQVGPGTITSGNYIASYEVYSTPTTTLTPTAGLIHLFISNPITNTTTYSSNPTALISTNVNTSFPVGKTQSSYGVNPNGSASYSVPIEVPPGTKDVVPNLSIVYNSQSQNGLLGYGWNLAGLHSIIRMGQSMYANGEAAPVSYTNSDWFALDGEKLLVTNGQQSTLNGLNGTTYSTEHESFSLITSNIVYSGSMGPDYFTVQTKDGLTMEFGNTADSKFTPIGSNLAIFAWYLNKVTDANGNYMTYKYYNNNDGQFFIKEIDYTGNTNIGFAPYNSIVFSYALRNDPNTSYCGGGQFNSNVLLNTITVNCQGSYMKKYNLNYYWDNNNNISLLQSITEYGTDLSNLNSLQFSYTKDYDYNLYTNPNPASLQSPSPALSFSYNATTTYRVFVPLDINGDGKKDLLCYDAVPTEAGLSYEGWVSNPCKGLLDPALFPVDWNAWEPLINTSTNNNSTQFSSSFSASFPGAPNPCIPGNATQFSSEFYPINSYTDGNIGYKLVDFNGDGREDVAFESEICITNPTTSNFHSAGELDLYPIYFNYNGTSYTQGSTLKTYQGISTYTNETALFLVDLNGDKKADVFNYVFDPTTGFNNFQLWLDVSQDISTPPNNFTYVDGSSDYFGKFDFSHAIPMDLYGDGRTEIVNIGQVPAGVTPKLYILEFDESTNNGVASYDGTNYYIGNGLVFKYDAYNSNFFNNSINYISFYDPPPFYGNPPNILLSPTLNYYPLFGDFNGDGISDIVYYSGPTSTPSWQMYLGDGTGNYPPTGSGIDLSSLRLTDPLINYLSIYYFAEDVNGDGKDDILMFQQNTPTTGKTEIYVYYSTGIGFTSPVVYTIDDDIDPERMQISFGDFNGDGVNDLFYVDGVNSPSTPKIFYFYKGAQSRRMEQAVDGYNQNVKFYYQPLSAEGGTAYSQLYANNYFAYPVMDYDGPMYVTSCLTTPDGSGNNSFNGDTSSTIYTYNDVLIDEEGKGFIGFLGFNALNEVSNIYTATQFQYDMEYYNVTNKFVYTYLPTNPLTSVTDARYTNTITSTIGTIGNLSEFQSTEYANVDNPNNNGQA